MPGVLHQGILSLFCDDPWLAHDLLGRERPVDATPVDRRADIDLTTTDPKESKHRLLDLVLVARDPADPTRGVAIDVETQLQLDESKYWRICGYLGILQDLHQVPAQLVYVSFSRRVSRDAQTWCTRPGIRIDMLLIDADTVPPIRSLEAALARPTAAVLVAALHGCRGNIEAARMGIAACRDLPEEQQRRYIQIILAACRKRTRDALMREMRETNMEQPDPLWELERRSGTYLLGLETGRSEGRAEGRSEGRRMTLVELILTVLDVRGFTVSPAAEARVRGCESLETLQHWARRVRDVVHIDELFDD